MDLLNININRDKKERGERKREKRLLINYIDLRELF